MTTTNSTISAIQRAADLRARRERAGLTRTRLAGLVGCSPTSLANIEDGAIPRHSAVLVRALAVIAEHDQALIHEQREPGSHRAPAVARVSVNILRALRAALHGAERGEIERLIVELDHLIDMAKWSAEPL